MYIPNPKRVRKAIPPAESDDAERAFWTTADSTQYVDWASARPVRLLLLKPSTTAISLRLPDTLLTALKILANERDH